MKRNLIVAIFLILIIVSSIVTLFNRQTKEGINYKEVYIENCMANLESLNITQEIEFKICNCSYEYQFNIYGKEVYKRDFVVTNRTDSLAMIDCLIEALGADSLNNEDVLRQLQKY